jgi:hypothetical protein
MPRAAPERTPRRCPLEPVIDIGRRRRALTSEWLDAGRAMRASQHRMPPIVRAPGVSFVTRNRHAGVDDDEERAALARYWILTLTRAPTAFCVFVLMLCDTTRRLL